MKALTALEPLRIPFWCIQVANALQISPRTVEAHLARAYRKLDIRTRAELGARIARGGLGGPASVN